MQLPEQLQAVIVAFVAMLVAEGLKALGKHLKIDLSGYVASTVAAVTGLVLAIANGLFGQIPPQYANLVNVIVALLLVVLGPMAIHSYLKRRNTVMNDTAINVATVEEVQVKS